MRIFIRKGKENTNVNMPVVLKLNFPGDLKTSQNYHKLILMKQKKTKI